jgi:acyl-[acyl-carrier-protein] desaturase
LSTQLEIAKEIDEQRPRTPAGLLSRQEKDRLIERGAIGLYRWYVSRSQVTRNWNPDQSFDWRKLRTDHSTDMNTIFEGFFAVEQYVPDYTTSMINLMRKSHGRSNFQIRWGSEEAKHADLWLNALLFSRHRTPAWIAEYQTALRDNTYSTPWDDALHMGFYALIQERATELNYLNTAIIARGESERPALAGDKDPLLADVAHTIAVDEAAHYHFFLEIARLFVYYYPARALEALTDVIQHFAMPAMDIIPNSRDFYDAIHRTGVYSTRHFSRDVLQTALDNLTVKGRKALSDGVKRMRQVPDPNGNARDTAIFDLIDYSAVQRAVKRLFGRIEIYEKQMGLSDVNPTIFVPSGMTMEGSP